MQLGQPRYQIALLALILAGQTKLIQVTFIQNYKRGVPSAVGFRTAWGLWKDRFKRQAFPAQMCRGPPFFLFSNSNPLA